MQILNSLWIKILEIIFPLITLFLIRQKEQKILSKEYLNNIKEYKLSTEKEILNNFLVSKKGKTDYEIIFSAKENKKYKIKKNNRNIALFINLKDKILFKKLFDKILRFNSFGNKIIIFFGETKYLEQKIIEKDYFVEIKIETKELGKDSINFCLNNIDVINSDVFFAATKYFGINFYFDFFKNNLYRIYFKKNIYTKKINYINLSISNSKISLDNLCKLIRSYQMIDSHSLGSYYFIPTCRFNFFDFDAIIYYMLSLNFDFSIIYFLNFLNSVNNSKKFFKFKVKKFFLLNNHHKNIFIYILGNFHWIFYFFLINESGISQLLNILVVFSTRFEFFITFTSLIYFKKILCMIIRLFSPYLLKKNIFNNFYLWKVKQLKRNL